jgi:hypothetical protein
MLDYMKVRCGVKNMKEEYINGKKRRRREYYTN